MSQPKLSKSVQQRTEQKKMIVDLSPSEIEAREKNNTPLDWDLTPEEVSAREAQKQQMLKNLSAAPTPEPAPTVVAKAAKGISVESLIQSFTGKATEANATLLAERRAVIEAEANPLLAEAQSLLTRHGILVNKHLAHVAEIAATDWQALTAAVPEDLQFDTKANMMVSRNHTAIRQYAEAATRAAAGLKSSFGDQQVGRELDPVSLQHAVQMMQSMVAGGAWDGVDGLPSAAYQRLLSHLRVWVERGRRLVETTADAVARFYRAEAVVKEILANVTPLAVEGTPPRATLPAMDGRAPGSGQASSYVDIDTREPDLGLGGKSDGPAVTRTQHGARVGSIRNLPERGDGKVVGVTEGR